MKREGRDPVLKQSCVMISSTRRFRLPPVTPAMHVIGDSK
jgi:hypothetical protein